MTIYLVGDCSKIHFQHNIENGALFGHGTSEGPAGCRLIKGLLKSVASRCPPVIELFDTRPHDGRRHFVPKGRQLSRIKKTVTVGERSNGHRSAVLCNMDSETLSVETHINDNGPSGISAPLVQKKKSDILCVFLNLPHAENNDFVSNLILIDEFLSKMSKQKTEFGDVVVCATLSNIKRLRQQKLEGLNKLLNRKDVYAQLITDVTCFREKAYIISKGLTWEKTFFEIQEMTKCNLDGTYTDSVAEIEDFDEVIVRFGIDGAFHIHNGERGDDLVGYSSEQKENRQTGRIEEKVRSRYDGFYFDPLVFEGELESEYRGSVSCQSEVFCASLILDRLDGMVPTETTDPISRAIIAVRRNYLNGYKTFSGRVKGVDPFVVFDRKYVLTRGINAEFQPFSILVETQKSDPDDEDRRKSLTFYERITSLNYESAHKREDAVVRVVRPLAEKVARKGLRAAAEEGFSVASFGKLQTIDRREIENLRSIYRRIVEFISETSSQKPLSLAVFGPPGCGKSFSVKQLIEELSKSNKTVFSKAPHEINVSQLSSASELAAAFQSVRSDVIAGRIPIVFIDEFDSDYPGGAGEKWFKYFLAPMQDGVFRDDVASHAIGKVIFVFAGGTAPSYKEFDHLMRSKPDGFFENQKVPDFLSRLSGYIDVSGPNSRSVNKQSKVTADEAEKTNDETAKIADEAAIVSDTVDFLAPIRRAILLRSIAKSARSNIFSGNELKIDERLLRALLNTGELHMRHGARSLESIIMMSTLSDAFEFNQSHLPPNHMLNMHVDASVFHQLISGFKDEN